MQTSIILGAFQNAEGGRIYLRPSENIERQAMSGTLLHEACHAYLNKTTVLGFLQNILQMEALAAEDTDPPHSEKCAECAQILVTKTRSVQEIYANNIELLTTEEQLGRAEMLRALQSRPKEYQQFYMDMQPVHQSGCTLPEKLRLVQAFCEHAMNVSVPADVLTNAERLAAFLQGDLHPRQRLEQALRTYQMDGTLPASSPDAEKLWTSAAAAAKHTRPYLTGAIRKFGEITAALTEETAELQLYTRIMDMVSLFEPAMLRPRRMQSPPEGDVFLALRQVQNLLAPTNFYCIGFENGYQSWEADAAALFGQLSKSLSICIPLSEYNLQTEAPKELDPGQTLLTVIFQTRRECAQWLEKAQAAGTVYVSVLHTVCGQSDISLLFFSRRGRPQTVFVFPTLREMQEALLRDFNLKKSCLTPDDPHFLRVFSHLEDEIGMLRYLKGLLPLLLARPWNTIRESTSLGPLAASAGRNLLDNAMRFKLKTHYKILAALPPKTAAKAPLYLLMRFQDEQNTGDTYANSQTNAPLLFGSREDAEQFAARYAAQYSAAGLDLIYWPFFRDMVQKLGGKVLLVLDRDGQLGKLADIDEVEKMWYR